MNSGKADRAAQELAKQLDAFSKRHARDDGALASHCRMCADHLRSSRQKTQATLGRGKL